MKRNEIVPMNKSEKGYFQDGFSVLKSGEMSEIQGGDRNNGDCSGNATCNGNGICKGNGGRCVGNDNCNNACGSGIVPPSTGLDTNVCNFFPGLNL